jgi:chromosomal replication initiation ATPase DnaA
MSVQPATNISFYVYPGLSFPLDNELKQLLFWVCNEAGVTLEEAMSKSRVRDIADARGVYCYLARKHTGYSFREIGDLIGLSHDAVIHYVNRVAGLIDVGDKKIMRILGKMGEIN